MREEGAPGKALDVDASVEVKEDAPTEEPPAKERRLYGRSEKGVLERRTMENASSTAE